MKYALLFLLVSIGGNAYAQPIYRCESTVTTIGSISFQGEACAEPSQEEGARKDLAPEASLNSDITGASLKSGLSGKVSRQQIEQLDAEWIYQQRRERRRHPRFAEGVETQRVQNLLQAETVRKAAEYAQNHQRCQTALQVAALCGKYAGLFSCDDKGFQATQAQAKEARNPYANITTSNSSFKMDLCTQQASRSGP